MKIRICDICGKPINHSGEVEVKIKMRKRTWFGDYSGWEKYEICNECQKNMIEWMSEEEDEEEDVND